AAAASEGRFDGVALEGCGKPDRRHERRHTAVSAHPPATRTEVVFDLCGSVALVVGASTGIGEQVARAFARAGATVMLAARDPAALRGVVEAITASGGTAAARITDVTSPDDCRAVVELALNTFGRLDFAFNNAASGPVRPRRWPRSTPPTLTAPWPRS